MKSLKDFMGKIILVFCMTLIFGALWSSNAFASETLKPNVTGLGLSGTWTVNGSTNVYGSKQTPNSLLDGVQGRYSDSNTFYFYNPEYYIDITLNQPTNIWAIGSSDDPQSFKSLVCQKFDGENWINFDEYSGGDGSTWNKIFSNLPAGRYKFFQKSVGAYAIYGEWYLETAETSATTNISLNKSTDNLQVGQIDDLVTTTTPATTGVTWLSSDSSIATVDQTGKVTAIKAGQATITATTTDGSNLSATCVVTVNSLPIETGITLNKTSDSINLGQTDILVATVTAGTTNNVTWSSSDSSIATVDLEGKVTAIKAGTVNITATAVESGQTATCTITVPTQETPTSLGTVLNIEPEKNQIHLNEVVSANVVIDNITEIAAEDVRIKYDNTKLKFLGIDEVDGIKLVKSEENDGELRVILASKGIANVVNDKKILLKLNFQGIASGEALVDVTKGRVSDGIEMERDLTDSECGQATIIIDDIAILDVNNSGEFTLLDLAIDARHLEEDPTALSQYNTDQVINGAIDNDDLTKIGEYMLANPNYTFN